MEVLVAKVVSLAGKWASPSLVICCEIILWYSVKICCHDWLNKETEWPIAEQDKVR